MQAEIMDDPALDADQHAAALRGLRRVHALSGTIGRLWRPIERLITTDGLHELSIMDVGCGDGCILRQLWQLAHRRGCNLRLHACDFSPRALEICGQVCEENDIPVSLHQVDVLHQSLPGPVDVVINSLFLHHFSDDDVVPIIKQMAASAGRLMMIEDLSRSRLSYYLVWLGVHVLTRCRVVHIDGPLSVKAAFSNEEMRRILDQADLRSARIQKCWPERLFITWEAPHGWPTEKQTIEPTAHAR